MRPLVALTRPRKDRTFTFGGTGHWEVPPFWSNLAADREDIDCNFAGYIEGAYKANGVVFACILARMLVFSEARFQFQRITNGRPGDLFGDQSLALLETPWRNGTTGELLARMEQDASLAGNFYATKVDDQDGQRIRRLRPDWVTIVSGSRSGGGPNAVDARVVAYIYKPDDGTGPMVLTPEQVAHWSPIPDPDAHWRGMSWLSPIVTEIKADMAATKHKLKFFEHGAVPSMVITYDPTVSKDAFEAFVEKFTEQHQGATNAYKTLHLGGGADVKTTGADLKQLDFKVTQGAGETRIAAAAGTPPVIVGLSEGLQGSSLNAGNFGAAKRLFGDRTIRPNWRGASAALQALVPPPPGSRLWYDARDVSFLAEDEKDAATILTQEAETVRRLVDAGFDPDAVIAAVAAGDLRGLTGKHSGLYSVQLQPAGAGTTSQEGA